MKTFVRTLIIATVLLSGACSDEPATIDEVTAYAKEEFADEGAFEVVWTHVEPETEPGKFKVIVDRMPKSEDAVAETQICRMSATKSSKSFTCDLVKPSIIEQASQMLVKQYEGRGIVVADRKIEREAKGTGFAGYFVLTDAKESTFVRVPCKGTQTGERFDINCDQEGAQEVERAD